MEHQRTLIREAMVALLVSANTAAGARVSDTRIDPHRKGDLPAISVYTPRDEVDRDRSTDAEDTHGVELEIAGWVEHSEDVSAAKAMDRLAKEIEDAITADRSTGPRLGGTAGEVRLVSTVMQHKQEDGRSDPLVGIVVLTYDVTYRTDLVAAAAVDDFRTAAATHQIADPGPAVDANAAKDQFTVQEAP